MAKFRNVDPADPYTPCFGVNGVPVLPAGEEGELEPEGWIRVGDEVRVTRVLDAKELELVTKGKKEATRR